MSNVTKITIFEISDWKFQIKIQISAFGMVDRPKTLGINPPKTSPEYTWTVVYGKCVL